ncbi:MAG: STAS/SEC14 domain-containing protein [Acidobacteriota bacterium]
METTSGRLSTDEIILAVAQLSLPEIEEVFDHVLALQAERKAAHLSPAESALLVRINEGLPADLLERLATLKAKRKHETISDAEYEELTRLGDQAEELHADRLAALVELAKLRGVSLPVLLDQLGIHFPDDSFVHEIERKFRRLVMPQGRHAEEPG